MQNKREDGAHGSLFDAFFLLSIDHIILEFVTNTGGYENHPMLVEQPWPVWENNVIDS